MTKKAMHRHASAFAFCISLSVLAFASPARANSEIIATGFTGILTADVWEDAIQVWDADYLSSGLVGVAIGQDPFRFDQFSFGYEVQLVQHFGEQDHFEVNLPLVVSYDRYSETLPLIGSLAFGLGLSWASEKPKAEARVNGDSTQTLIYWMAEVGFDIPQTEFDAVIRLHHRSDGFGLMAVDSGSNALALGLRRQF